MRPPIELMKTIAAAGAADRRQHRLGDRDVGDQVDLDLAAEVLDRHRLQRARDRDAGVVDEAVEAAAGSASIRAAAAAICSASVTSSISGDEALGAGLRAAPRRPASLAHSGEDPPAGGVQAQGGRAADAGRSPGDQNRTHTCRL